MALTPEENPLYSKASDLHQSHWEKLAAREPGETARAAGAGYEKGCFTLRVAGSALVVDPVARRVSFLDSTAEPGYQRALVAVAYLGNAIDAPASGRLLSPRELPGGQGFFRGPHSTPTAPLGRVFGADTEAFARAAEKIGGVQTSGGGIAYSFLLLPKIPAQAVLWPGDGEMHGEAALLVDARAHLFLPLDVVWAALNVLVGDLLR